MKKRLLILQFLLIGAYCSFSQSVGIGTATPDVSAALDITATNKGLLIPRMNTASMLGIASPANGLMIYDTQTNQLKANIGTPAAPNWQPVASAAGNAWNLAGNGGINPVNQFLGTTDNQPLRFRINNIKAGELNPSGNIFWGLRAGQSNTSGFSNVAIGTDALKLDAGGANLVAIGDSALFNNGKDNPVPGALGVSNTAIGSKALFTNTIGNSNTATGTFSLFSNTIGSDNSAYGTGSLFFNTTGGLNTAIGAGALSGNTIGNDNTATGAGSLHTNSTGNFNSAFGSLALNVNSTGDANVAVGYAALTFNSTGDSNTAVGQRALLFNTSGEHNTGIGSSALFSNTTGQVNTAVGNESLLSNLTGNNNTGIGNSSLRANNSGNNNTALGSQSLFRNTVGINNVATGFQSLFANIDGINNTAEGNSSLSSNTSGFQNTAIGTFSLFTNVTGNSNTAIGFGADVTSANLFNATAIGEGALVNASNKIRLGNSAVTVIEGQVPFTTPSDGRFKYMVKEDVKGLDFILQLRPVTYQFDVKRFDEQQKGLNGDKSILPTSYIQASYDEAAAIRRTGFIAQEVERAANASGYNFSGVIKPTAAQDHYSLSYESFVVPLVKAAQEQQQMINELKKENEGLKKTNSEQKNVLDNVLLRLKSLESDAKK